MKNRIRLTESGLRRIIKESVKNILKEVALKGKSGKTYSLHGTDPESWAIMARLRGKNGYCPNTPQFYHACRDEGNWIELDDKAHPNLRSRNNANRINAMMNRIDGKSKDIMAANESKTNRIVKETKAFDTDNQAESSYFQTMMMRLSGLSNYKENPEISSRARQILDDIKQSDMSPLECIETYWDESQELKKRYWDEKESDLHRIVKESVNRILMEVRKPNDRIIGRHKFRGEYYDKNGNPIYTHPSKLDDPEGGTLSDDFLKNYGWRYSKSRGLHGQLSDPMNFPK